MLVVEAVDLMFACITGMLLAVIIGVVIGVLTGLMLLVTLAFCRHRFILALCHLLIMLLLLLHVFECLYVYMYKAVTSGAFWVLRQPRK